MFSILYHACYAPSKDKILSTFVEKDILSAAIVDDWCYTVDTDVKYHTLHAKKAGQKTLFIIFKDPKILAKWLQGGDLVQQELLGDYYATDGIYTKKHLVVKYMYNSILVLRYHAPASNINQLPEIYSTQLMKMQVLFPEIKVHIELIYN